MHKRIQLRKLSMIFILLSAGILTNDGALAASLAEMRSTPPSDSAAAAAAGYGLAGAVAPSVSTMAWSVQGDLAGAAFGTSVGTAGDVNADGYADVIVGAPSYDAAQPGVGRVFIFNGSANGLDKSASWSIDGGQPWASFAAAVGTAGDVNGDGYSDIIIGMPRYSSGQRYEGNTFVYLGSENGAGSSADWTYESNGTEVRFGSVVGTAGDVNGDGYSDVIIGAYSAGIVYVFHGSPTGLSATPDWVISRGGYLGWSAASAGDVNGDGYDDVIVGSKLSHRGQANVYHGSADGLNTAEAWSMVGEYNQAWFGYSVGSAGDVNGDGYADVIIGNQRGPKGAYIFHGSPSGLNTTADWIAQADQPGDWFAPAIVGPAGDVNADNYDDVIVRVYSSLSGPDGHLYLYYGSESGIDGAEPDVVEAMADFPGAGSVGSAGDVNGDGYSDLIIGSDRYENGQAEEGRAVLHAGSGSGLQVSPAITIDSALSDATVGISIYLNFSLDNWHLAPEGAHLQWSLDGVDQGPWYEESPILICGLSQGPHTVTLRMVDPDQNLMGTTSTVSFTVMPETDAGTPKWIFSTGDRTNFTAPAAGPDGTLYTGSSDNHLYALEPDGCLKWSVPVDSLVTPVVGADGTVYVAHGKLSAFNPDGTLKWVFEQAANSPPAIAEDGTLYTKGWDNFLYAINPDGSLKWKLPIDNLWGGGQPAIGANGTIYVGSADNHLYAVLPNGSLQWRFATAGWLYESSIAIGDDGTIYAGSTDRYLYAVNPDGTEKWKFYSAQSKSSQVIGPDGTIYTMAGKWLWAIASDGTAKWGYDIASGSSSSPAIGADGLIYILASDLDPQNNQYIGRLHAVSPEGSRQWIFEFGSVSLGSSPLIDSNGTLYFGSDDGNIYAVNTGSGGLANSAWPVIGYDQRHSGRYVGPLLPPIPFPDHGGNDGSITVRIDGKDFLDGTTVKLIRKGESDIEGNPVSVSEDGFSIFTTFDLTDETLGTWDLVISNPDGTSIILPEGFTIEEVNIQLWAEIVGPEFIRSHRPQTHWINYGNRGNIDILGAHLFLKIPANVEFKIGEDEEFKSFKTGIVSHFYISRINANATGFIPISLRINEGQPNFEVAVAISNSPENFRIQHLAAYQSDFGINIEEVPDTGHPAKIIAFGGYKEFKEEACPGDPTALLAGGSDAPTGYVDLFIVKYPDSKAFDEVGVRIGDEVAWSFPDNSGFCESDKGCVFKVKFTDFEFNQDGIGHLPWDDSVIVQHVWSIRPGTESDLSNITWLEIFFEQYKGREFCDPSGPDCLSCIGFVMQALYPPEPCPDNPKKNCMPERLKPIYDTCPVDPIRKEKACDFYNFFNHWLNQNECKIEDIIDREGQTPEDWDMWFEREKNAFLKSIVMSIDPNEKYGSRGFGEEQYISRQEPLRYSIFFENLATATAPAQEVIVTDQLDLEKVDINTLSLGPITFGDKFITPPPGKRTFSSDVDLRPDNDLIVRVAASLDSKTGLLTWRLTSIDLETGELPNDPLVGFLPPNVNPPEGDGSVLFSVMPKKDLITGWAIRNSASIVFDTNEPIDTPAWLNTIDSRDPVSQVMSLPSTQNTIDFEVQWSGTDEGAGVKDYSIYVSTDNDDYAEWLSGTLETSRSFSGAEGKTYAFYSIARDKTGNIEESPEFPDAKTTIRTPCEGDHEPDGDVDGDDLSNLFGPGGIDLNGFAQDFGRVGCP